jgi:5'-deoxynucleotidase YfbR-like HD superfamily hydrolase
MQTKAPMATPPDGASPTVRAYFEWQHLKQLYRQGWLRRGVPAARCESVADHVLGTALLAMQLADAHHPELDAERVLRLALIHDLGEAHAGDLTPADGVDQADKHHRERAAVVHIVDGLEGGPRLLALWDEYEAGRTPEAHFVRQVDKLEMALQAAVYERHGGVNLGEFFTSARSAIEDPALLAVLDELEGSR